MIPNNFIDFYGDQHRWFIGQVVNVLDDPLKLGRVKVRAFGLYDNIEDKDLPWAQITVPVTTGIHEGVGRNLGMVKYAQVFGIFLDGNNSQLPLVLGVIPKENDTNSKALDNYPFNKVYETESGHYKEYDDTEGSARIKQYHKSGTYYEIDNEGSHHDEIVKDHTINVAGNETVNIKGERYTIIGKGDKLEVTGDVTITVSGNTLIDCSSVTITGDLRVNGGVSVGSDVTTDAGISHNSHTHTDPAGIAGAESSTPN